MARSLSDWEALYPEKIEHMRSWLKRKDRTTFTPSMMMRELHTGFNHTLHVIESGVLAGTLEGDDRGYSFTGSADAKV